MLNHSEPTKQLKNEESNNTKESELLKSVCKAYDISLDAVKTLVNVERSMIGKKRRRGLQNQIDSVIQSTIMSKEKETDNVN
jgi:hypothetical protein